MTSKITESVIEQFVIDLLVHYKYQYIYGLDIAPDSDNSSPSGDVQS